jgi:hypothetical protein
LPGDEARNPDVPSRLEHLAKAESNHQLALALQTEPYLDWSTTVLFYSALHLVEATLAPFTHSRSHSERFANVNSHQHLRPLFRHYRYPYDVSLDSRYDCWIVTTADVQRLYLTRYEPIKRHLQPLLGLTF